jgi:hypothetical protein
MARLGMAMALGAGLLLVTGAADAQWRYTDDKGVSRVTQYRINVPSDHRDAAEWIGPVGVGKPALSEEQMRRAQHSEAVRRIVAAEAGLLQFKNVPAPTPPQPETGGPSKPLASMCVTGEMRVMTSPGIWKVVGGCASGFSTDYGTAGYGQFGGVTVR